MRSVGLITLCFVSSIAFPVSAARAEPLQDFVGQASRTVQKSWITIERTASELAAEAQRTAAPSRPRTQDATQAHGASEPQDTEMRLTPPDPERKPRPPMMKPRADAAWPMVLPAKDAAAAPAATVSGSWSEQEIALARAQCAHLLKTLDAVTLPEAPIKEGSCGDPAPVRLVSIGSVQLSPPPVVNCQMVAALSTWLEKDLQPLARKHLRAPITGINVMSSYSCRNTYGNARGRLSEHGRANALDIRGFETKKDSDLQILAHWGPTKQDVEASRRMAAEAKRIAAEKAAAAKAAEKAMRLAAAEKWRAQQKVKFQKAEIAPGFAIAGAGLYKSIVEGIGEKTEQVVAAVEQPAPTVANRLGGPEMPAPVAGPQVKTPEERAAEDLAVEADDLAAEAELAAADPAPQPAAQAKPDATMPGFTTITTAALPLRQLRPVNSRYARFLHEAHTSACRIFGTVLGPEANRAHRNHLHIDLSERRELGSYCR